MRFNIRKSSLISESFCLEKVWDGVAAVAEQQQRQQRVEREQRWQCQQQQCQQHEQRCRPRFVSIV